MDGRTRRRRLSPVSHPSHRSGCARFNGWDAMPKTPLRLKRPATARAKRDTSEHTKHASISFEPGRSAHLLPTDKPTTGRSDTRTAPTDFATFMANRVSENIAVRRARIDSVQTHKMPVFLPPQEVMKMLGISRTTLNAMSKDGRLRVSGMRRSVRKRLTPRLRCGRAPASRHDTDRPRAA